MIARIWHGWTTIQHADRYERLLRTEILPEIADRGFAGYLGAHLLRKDGEAEVEFVTILWFETLDSVRAFAGEDYETAYVPPQAREVLSRWDDHSRHYEVRSTPQGEPR